MLCELQRALTCPDVTGWLTMLDHSAWFGKSRSSLHQWPCTVKRKWCPSTSW